MESAPASMPATIPGIFRCAFAPTATVTFRCSATSPARSQSWARRITGTSPAHDTRFGSSNCAEVSFALCNNRISQMPFGLGAWGLRKHHHPRLRGHLPCHDTINTGTFVGGSRLRAWAAKSGGDDDPAELDGHVVVGRFGLRGVPAGPGPVTGHVGGGVPVQRVPDGDDAEADQPNGTVRSTARRVRLRASPTPMIWRASAKACSIPHRAA